jgi:hypothetical protein
MTRCMTMKARMSKPLAIRVHPEFSVPLNRMIDEIVPMTSTPSNDPMMKP